MISLIKSTFYNEKKTKKELVNFILKTERLSMGKECQRFEDSFVKKQQKKFAVFVSNGSMANLVLIQSLLNLGRLKQKDKIGVSGLTWATNIMPLIQLGLSPVFLDCELNTLNVSSDILKKNKNNLKALFLTNALGFCDDINKIKEICREKDILFIEDNCESLGSKIETKLLGSFGIASTFSFFVGHHLSTIEGGMICTDDKELRDMLVMTRAHGWDRSLKEEDQKRIRNKNKIDKFFASYSFYDLAYNARPTEINGFLGNTQLQYWDEIVARRFHNFRRFQKEIEDNDELLELNLDHMDLVSNFAMPVICKNKKAFNKYKEKFEKEKIEIRPVIAGDITRQPFFKKYFSKSKELKNSYFAHQNGFYFPNNPELTEKEINLMCNLLKK